MKTRLLQTLAFAGFCWLATSAMPTANADSCPHGSGCPCPQCAPGYCRTGCQPCCLEPAFKWLTHCDYYILPPDYGWVQPTKVPVIRRGVTYERYWPEVWYGTGTLNSGEYRTYPTIANPTDTTQLGYTYQQVPYWQPQSRRVPPAPVPSQWHVRDCHYGVYGRYHNSFTPIHERQPRSRYYVVVPISACPVQATPSNPAAPDSGSEQAPKPNQLEPVPDVPIPPPPPEAAGGKDKTARGSNLGPSAMVNKLRRNKS